MNTTYLGRVAPRLGDKALDEPALLQRNAYGKRYFRRWTMNVRVTDE